MTVVLETKTPPTRYERDHAVGTSGRLTVDARGLERALRASVRGEVRFGAGDRAMYSTDASNYRMVPLGVVLPHDAEDVVAAVATARRFGAPIFARGGGTGIPGQSCNDGLLLDFSKYMNSILWIDPDRRLARVEPGVVLDSLRKAAEHHRLTFGPDPATHNRCTLGGMLGNNSCGIHSVQAGRTVDNVEDLEVLTYDGLRMRVGRTSDEELARIIRAGGRRAEIYAALDALRRKYADLIRERYPKIPRRSSGYSLDELLPERGFHVARALVGSECTCVTILDATLDLVDSPRERSLLVVGYPDVFTAADHVPQPLAHEPIALEGLDDEFIDDMKRKGMHPKDLALMPEGKAWLLVEFGGESKQEADAKARALMDELAASASPPPVKLFDDPKQEALVWRLREAGLGATARVPGKKDNWEGWEDSAVAPERLGDYLRDLRALLDRYDYHGPLYGHFGDGCVHTRLDFDLETAGGIRTWRAFLDEAADLVVGYGGSLSGEHGDGQARGELLPKMYGPELVEAFREFKAIWDPGWMMNPGKLVEPYRIDENMRLGTTYNPADPETHFQFPDDKNSFAYAALRCVGAGECRRTETGTMCPSYMVTLEEKHSTRGRARLLFEMLRGDPVTGGWQSEEVKEALDLCLACKGCKGECPVQVDMATYKAEFLAHYFEEHRRPRTAFTMGRIDRWARLAAHAPRVVNALAHAPGLAPVAKALAGIHPDRTIPYFAPETFKQWFAKRGARSNGRERVILWADTFNDHFHPETASAAVAVLEAAGFDVRVPRAHLCCGRPLYDWGLLGEAKARLVEILATLGPAIDRGLPVVVLEPSCASVFRDELVNLLPNDERAKRLRAQTYLLGELLVKRAPEFEYPRLERRALLHGHCHQKSLFTMTDEETVLAKLGLEVDAPDTGCCGMAGAFGFERDHHDVSMRCGERVLLPAVRSASEGTLIISDGYSCREQIAQATGRRALHLAEVLEMALGEESSIATGGHDELAAMSDGVAPRAWLPAAAVASAAVLAGGALLWAARARSSPMEEDRRR